MAIGQKRVRVVPDGLVKGKEGYACVLCGHFVQNKMHMG